MKIWSLEEEVDVYEHITLEDGSDEKWIEFGAMFNWKSLKDKWSPLSVRLIEHGGKLKKGDIPYLSPGKPVFTKKAVQILEDLIEESAEILPIQYGLQELYLINVINHIDAINYEMADIKFMPDGKRILRVKKHSFSIEKVREQHIFKIVNQLAGTVFVSDEFRDRVLEGGLEGFKFVEVWNSEK